MVTPHGFRVEYAINPYMRDENGALKVVDAEKAHGQWHTLFELYRWLGLDVEILDGSELFPDMVFCANPIFPFIDSRERKTVLLAHMHAFERQGEIEYYRHWALTRGYNVVDPPHAVFEGCGDAIWNFETGEVFGGYGYRTQLEAYEEVEKILGRDVHRLKICDPQFYHLDTCLSILRGDVVVFVEEAFDREGIALLERSFRHPIRILREEALNFFAGNCFSPNGKDVVLHPGANDLIKKLEPLNFTIHEVDTSEFMKAGGSVFCLKQTLF